MTHRRGRQQSAAQRFSWVTSLCYVATKTHLRRCGDANRICWRGHSATPQRLGKPLVRQRDASVPRIDAAAL
jgi:hypothetical protein